MKWLYGLLAALVCLSVLLIQPQLTASSHFDAVATEAASADAAKLQADNFASQGSNLLSKGDYQGAIAKYNQAIALNPNNPFFYTNRAIARQAFKDYQGAIASFNQIIEINQSDNLVPAPSYLFPLLYENTLVWFEADFAWFHKACSYAMQGEIEQAIESLQRAIELDAEQWREAARTTPALAELHPHQQFQQLIWPADAASA